MTTTAHEDQPTPAPVEVTRVDHDRALEVFNDILCDMGNYVEFGAPPYKHEALETIASHCARHRIDSALAGEVEPVAWMYKRKGFMPVVSTRQQTYGYLEWQHPLYTHPAPPADVVEALRDELANYDAVVKSCPANKMFLGDKACPKCKAESNEGCREKIRACFSFLSNARAALAKHGGA